MTSTSELARANHERSGAAQTHRETVLSLVRNWPNHTAVELWQIERDHGDGNMDRHEVSRRLPEIERMGLIHRGEKRACSSNGNLMVVWLPGPAPSVQGRLFE